MAAPKEAIETLVSEIRSRISSAWAKTISYGYDQAGYLIYTGYPDGTDVNITTDFKGRIGVLKYEGSEKVRYEYIGSRVAKRSYTYFTPDIVYQPTYDNLGRITSADSGENFAKFGYTYEPNTNNISNMIYYHRPNDPCVTFSYDNLDRLTQAAYGAGGLGDNNEIFTMDDLGNRTNVNIRSGSNIAYAVDANTNRYNTVGGNSLTYDSAGNTTKDKDSYTYYYDYENRLIKVKKTNDTVDVVQYDYDALGRRIRKRDFVGDANTIYYNNYNWQVLCEYGDSGCCSSFLSGYCTRRPHTYSAHIIQQPTLDRLETNSYKFGGIFSYRVLLLFDTETNNKNIR